MIYSKQDKNILKEIIISFGVFDDYNRCHKELEVYGNRQPFDDFINSYGWDIFSICRNLRLSKHDKYQRVNKRIYEMLDYCKNPIFCTFTFSDEVLFRTSKDTRRQYVRRFLKSNGCTNFIANIDYGSENGREHYHAIVDREIVKKWKYGFTWYKKISPSDAITKVKKYVVKYTMHALKSTTEKDFKIDRLIYSRLPKSDIM